MRQPLATITRMASAFTQWLTRTNNGWIGPATRPSDGSSGMAALPGRRIRSASGRRGRGPER